MKVIKYKVLKSFCFYDILFLIDDTIYIEKHEDTSYQSNFFLQDRTRLKGRIDYYFFSTLVNDKYIREIV